MQPWYFDRDNQSLEEGTVANTVTKGTIKEKSLIFFSISAVRSKDGWSSERWLEKMMKTWREGNWKEDESRPPQRTIQQSRTTVKARIWCEGSKKLGRGWALQTIRCLSEDMGELARWGCISAQFRLYALPDLQLVCVTQCLALARWGQIPAPSPPNAVLERGRALGVVDSSKLRDTHFSLSQAIKHTGVR